ncbi:MAG: hypothetical protein IPP47_01860 [Bryobacterales bacterium]|nr:hypothetical protein [Bryobacterales bacterium]
MRPGGLQPRVVGGEPFADAVGGDAHNGVLPGVVGSVTAEDLDANGPLFQTVEPAAERVLYQVGEECPSALAAGEFGAVQDAAQLFQHFRVAVGHSLRGRVVSGCGLFDYPDCLPEHEILS